MVGHHRAAADFQEAVAQPFRRVVQPPRQRHLQRVSRRPVQYRRLRNAPMPTPLNLPAVARAVTAGDTNPLDVVKGAQGDAAILRALEAHGVRALEVPVLQAHLHRAVRTHFTVLAQHIEHITAAHLGQMHVLQFQGLVDAV